MRSVSLVESAPGSASRICSSFSCLAPQNPTLRANSLASRRLPMTSLISPFGVLAPDGRPRRTRGAGPARRGPAARYAWSTRSGSCSSRGTRRTRRPRTTPAGTPASRRPAPCHTKSGTHFSALFLPSELGQGTRQPALEILNIELVERLPGRQCARRGDVARAAHDRVVRVEHRVEVDLVGVVEAGALRRRPIPRRPIAPARNAASSSCCGRLTQLVVDVTRHDHARAGLDLLEQLPLQHRHAGDLLEAEHGVVVRAGDLEALARAQPQRRVVSRVEELRGPHRVALAVEHLQVDVDLGVRCDVASESIRRVVPSAILTRVVPSCTVAHCRRAVVGVGGAEVPVAVDRAGSAARSPAPCGRARRRSTGRRGGGTCP